MQHPPKPFYVKVVSIVVSIVLFIVTWFIADFFINFSSRQAAKQEIARLAKATEAPDVTSKEFNSRINSYFVAHYIRNRESFLYDSVAENYNVVRLMSEPGIYQDFVKAMDPRNPESNIAMLEHEGSRSIKFKSLTFIEPQVAEIHFAINEKTAALKQYNKIARIKFEYVRMNLTAEEQLINPLGFRVLEYQLEDDTLKTD